MNIVKQFFSFLSPLSDVEKNILNRDVWMNCTPEQYIMWNFLMTKFHPTKIESLVYEGTSGISQFENYDAHIIYYALEYVAGEARVPQGAYSYFTYYDETNTEVAEIVADCVYWDGAEKHVAQSIYLKNFYFSRKLDNGYDKIKFVGYKLTLP